MNNYKDKRWIEKRKAILKRDKYQCQECRRYGKLVDATHVHHCWPLEYYPEYKYCSWNLISLCTKCHNKMHDRESHELTTEGLRLKSLRVPPEEKNITPPLCSGHNQFTWGTGGGNISNCAVIFRQRGKAKKLHINRARTRGKFEVKKDIFLNTGKS